MIEPYTGKIKINLKKVHGQLALIDKMIVENRYCLDIAQQVNAAIGILKQVNNHILESHLLSCGTNKLESKSEKVRLEFVKELMKVFDQTKK
ncbi:MAG: Metal-sensitive transcriptional repressor [Candidatus Magasanikbacteria bacterium GW2011_GWC2_37_14]|uniref:Metal-sensitive transcriptional repressor n=1 Tax=Candidatus Magasanikbacteria bacterium GW2011_GWC2_37_14 TaxID=1619046 RepID=A0A0G0GC67_9BACT|nr:MAG: Metal-sensitive transcriptional repressor [Candidatus Magasanikbacteria bacterium GW2011_GWC2_37_14]